MLDQCREAGLSAFLAGSRLDDPYPLYAQIRETAPVFRLQNGLLVVTRYAAVDAGVRDRRFIHEMTRSIVDRRGAGPPGWT